MERTDFAIGLHEYIVKHGEHEISKEQRKVSEELGKPMMEFYKDGTQTIFEFPNGTQVSVIHFPNQMEMFYWDIEIMFMPKYGDSVIDRPRTIEHMNDLLHIWMLR